MKEVLKVKSIKFWKEKWKRSKNNWETRCAL